MSDGCGLPVRRIVLIPGPNDFARDSGSPPCLAAVQNTDPPNFIINPFIVHRINSSKNYYTTTSPSLLSQ